MNTVCSKEFVYICTYIFFLYKITTERIYRYSLFANGNDKHAVGKKYQRFSHTIPRHKINKNVRGKSAYLNENDRKNLKRKEREKNGP